jgi:hypothetical protein
MSPASSTIPQHQCQALRKDGQPCRGQAVDGTYCLAHSPSYKGKVAEARTRGGRNKSRAARMEKLMPIHLRPVYNLLAKAFVETYQGSLSPQQASALSSIAGTMVRVLTAGEMEARLRDLETAVNNTRQGHG